MPQKVNFQTLLESTNRASGFWAKAATVESQPFAVETGFHIYGELNLTLKLTAAAETTDATKLLQVLQEYVTIAETCAALVGAELLEVQGERIHLLLPAPQVTKDSVQALLRFCVAFTNTVYVRLQKLAANDFRGFKMAADHGRAVLVISGNQANASVVSLGICANAPAKQLRIAEPGKLRMRTEHYKVLGQSDEWREWTNIPVKTNKGIVMPVAAEDLMEQFASASEAELKNFAGSVPTVKFGSRDYLREALKTQISESFKAQGFGFRADLDGFSKQVAAAKNDSDVLDLVTRFTKIMAYPDYFMKRLGKPVVKLPWAGDCANLIVLPNGEGYDEAREFLPVQAASEWHSQKSGHDDSRTTWTTYFKESKWAVGIAGGDSEECSDGYILIAPLKGKRRDFLVAAGWGIGRSLDAQECDEVKGGDTVLHEIDYGALASTHQSVFSRLQGSSIFWVSNELTNEKIREAGAKVLAPKGALNVPGVSATIPTPKPWSKND